MNKIIKDDKNTKDNKENGNNTGYSYKRLNKCKAFQYYSRSLLSKVFRNPKCNFLYTVSKNFSEIVGEKYKNYCRLEKVNLVNENRQGNIYIISFNSSVSFYLNNNKSFIIEKINAIFGYDVVMNLFIKEIPQFVEIKELNKDKIISKEKIEKIEKIVADVKNSELKESLTKLGVDVLE